MEWKRPVRRAVTRRGSRRLLRVGVALSLLAGGIGCGTDQVTGSPASHPEGAPDGASGSEGSPESERGGRSDGTSPVVVALEESASDIHELRFRASTNGLTYDALGRAANEPGIGGAPSTASSLVPLAGYNQFWFAWAVFNDGSSIFGSETALSSGPIEEEAECAVPCEEIRQGCPGKDCIPALSDPVFVEPGDSRAGYLSEESFVVGVSVNGDTRAYPHNVLWWHEIVNDVVGGTPVAVTHCPLTFSSIGHDPTAFIEGETVELGVSGKLFNSNLVFYNRSDDTYFSQLLGTGTRGQALGEPAPRVHVWEMTWAGWRALFPDTLVLSGDTDDTGHARDYERYPYGDYFTDHENTFSRTNPEPDESFENKQLTYGLHHGGVSKAYVHDALRSFAEETYGAGALSGVVNDRMGRLPVAIVFDLEVGYVQAFDTSAVGELEIVR